MLIMANIVSGVVVWASYIGHNIIARHIFYTIILYECKSKGKFLYNAVSSPQDW